MMGMQDGDVVEYYVNIDALVDAVSFKPATPLKKVYESLSTGTRTIMTTNNSK